MNATRVVVEELEEVLSLFQPNAERLEEGRRRMEKVWRGKQPDHIPICFSVPVAEQDKYPSYDMAQEFHNPDVMLVKQLWAMIGVARSGSDAQPSARPNLGCGFLPTLFGLEQDVGPDRMPWLRETLSRKALESFVVPDDLSEVGLMPVALECLKRFREQLNGQAHVYIPDTQGPFDVAHLVRGDDIFTDMFDDSEFAHHVMSLCTEMYVKATCLLKEAAGEPLYTSYHSGMIFTANGGSRCCEDTSTLLSPALIDEFVIPYTQRALRELRGGWVHFCGKNDHLLKRLIEDVDECRGLNLGNPEMHDLEDVLIQLVKHGKCYYGALLRMEGEKLKDFFERMYAAVKEAQTGLIFVPHVNEEEMGDPSSVVNLWYQLQD